MNTISAKEKDNTMRDDFLCSWDLKEILKEAHEKIVINEETLFCSLHVSRLPQYILVYFNLTVNRHAKSE